MPPLIQKANPEEIIAAVSAADNESMRLKKSHCRAIAEQQDPQDDAAVAEADSPNEAAKKTLPLLMRTVR